MRAADDPRVFKALFAAMKAAATFSTPLAGRIAEKIWFTPWTVQPGPRGLQKQAAWLAPTRPTRFSSSHGDIAGFEAGSGPVVLLVHGWGEKAASLGGFIEPLVGAGFRVVGIDLPGHGQSARVEPNIYVMGEAITQVADQLGGVTAVIGHSAGGHSTMRALQLGLPVDSVVLISPSSRLQNSLVKFSEMLSVPPRAATGLKHRLEERFGESLWEDLEGSAMVSGLSVPALIFHDREDPQVPFEDSELLASAWRGARLIATGSLGHGRILRDPDVIKEAAAFLTAHLPTRSLHQANL